MFLLAMKPAKLCPHSDLIFTIEFTQPPYFSFTPSLPLSSADVIYGSPLTLLHQP